MGTSLPQFPQKKDSTEKKVVSTKADLKSLKTFELQNVIQTQKLKHGFCNTPAVLLNILTPASEIHSYRTRYATNQNFCKPSVRTNYGISTFKFSA